MGSEDHSPEAEGTGGDGDEAHLPDGVVDRAGRLTRLARDAVDEAEADAYLAEREAILGAHGYTARVREDDGGATLVCHPEAWLEDGTVQLDRVDDVDRGVEVPLSGPGDPDDWERIEATNRALADRVAAEHGDPHGATAQALADFAGNHYAKSIPKLTPTELEQFREEYLRRNAWPSDRQLARLDESLRLTYEAAGEPIPGGGDNGDPAAED